MKIDKNLISVADVERKVDLSLELYNFMTADTIYIRANHYSTTPQFTYEEVIEMYDQACKTWVYWQSQLVELEEYEICDKIKRLLDYEQKDCETMLVMMDAPVYELKRSRMFYEAMYFENEFEVEK